MKKRIPVLVPIFALSLVITLLGCILRIILQMKYIEPATGLYVAGSGVPFFFDIFIGTILVLAVIFYFLTSRVKVNSSFDDNNAFMVFASCFCGLMFFSDFILDVTSLYAARNYLKSFISQNPYVLPKAIFSFFSGIFFLSQCSATHMNIPKNARTLLAFTPAIWAALHCIDRFTDKAISINSPARQLQILSLCVMLLFFLSEIRLTFPANGKEGSSIGKIFTLSVLTMLLSFLSAVPHLALTAFWLIQPNGMSGIVTDILEIAIAIYAMSRAIILIGITNRENEMEDNLETYV